MALLFSNISSQSPQGLTSTTTSLLPRSKKISKVDSPSSGSGSPNSTHKKKYNTTSIEGRHAIMMAIVEELVIDKHLNVLSVNLEDNSELAQWREYLDEIRAKELNKVLVNVLPRFKEMELSDTKLTQWRKKVKAWFDTPIKRNETRGGGLIRENEIAQFKEALKMIIKRLHTMKSRSFTYLRQEILPTIQKIHKQSKDRKPKDNMFSKKYWNEFLNDEENSDIKALWNQIPKKSARYNKQDQLDSESDHCESTLSSQENAVCASQRFQEIPEPCNFSTTYQSEARTPDDNMFLGFEDLVFEPIYEVQESLMDVPEQVAGNAVFGSQGAENLSQYYLSDLKLSVEDENVKETELNWMENQVDLFSFWNKDNMEGQLQDENDSDFWRNNFGDGSLGC